MIGWLKGLAPSWLFTHVGAGTALTVTALGVTLAWGRFEQERGAALDAWAARVCAAAGAEFETRPRLFSPILGGKLPARDGACFRRVRDLRQAETEAARQAAELQKANTDQLIAELEARSAKGDTDARLYADSALRLGAAADRLAKIEAQLLESETDATSGADPDPGRCPADLPADYWRALADVGGLREQGD